ncbi:TraB/GumN family protein [Cellulosilyticum ruminicola]|uniref:TraB/GumN family protein n=1 Tax=Cellulosilyticum ruminicola TaxID=425254 RepID=UPI0006CFBF56|nr:TraB/GumN family protein [Cellulosilyticum ruminicola]
MKSSYKERLKRWGLFTLIGALAIMPLMAEEVTEADAPSEEIEATNVIPQEESDDYPSVWAVDIVMEGQNYGIYPLGWHDNFKIKMSKEQIEELQLGVETRISQIPGVRLKDGNTDSVIKGATKGEVIKQLFGVIKQFAYPKELGLNKVDAVTFMKAHGIIDSKTSKIALKNPCTVEEGIVLGTRLVDWLYEEFDASTKGYFWKVDGGKSEVYLLGSVHAADSRLYPFSKKVLDAYNKADVVGFEIDESNEADYDKFIKAIRYTDGTSLKDHVSKATYELLLSYSDLFDLTEEEMSQLKVWYLSSYISSYSTDDTMQLDKSEGSSDYGVDNYFFTKAHFDDKKIYGLESYELQAGMFDSFSDDLQETVLLQSLGSFLYSPSYSDWDEDDLWELEKSSSEWLTLIKNGDIEGFKKYYSQDDGIKDKELSAEYTQKLLTNRDKGMVEKIEKCLKDDQKNTYFIIVGAAHYISHTNSGVIDQLKQKGYNVTQIK